jgi:hypothetical protein
MGTLTVDLKAAGLTHAKGRSDNCGGEHAVDEVHVTGVTGAGWVPADGLEALFQRFHEAAHPDGSAYWENCREAACADAGELLNQED